METEILKIVRIFAGILGTGCTWIGTVLVYSILLPDVIYDIHTLIRGIKALRNKRPCPPYFLYDCFVSGPVKTFFLLFLTISCVLVPYLVVKRLIL